MLEECGFPAAERTCQNEKAILDHKQNDLLKNFLLTSPTVWSIHTLDRQEIVFLTLDADDKRAIYQQIADGIKTLIARGDLREGMPLPSLRQVAGDLGLNLNTIAIAYRLLQDEGFVTVRHGAGAVVSSRRVRQPGQENLLRPLRSALTEWILAGYSDREIAAVVQRELVSARQKGDPKCSSPR